MNQLAGHFFSQSRWSRKIPCWYNLLLSVLVALFMSFQYPILAQDQEDLLKSADDYYNNEQYHTAAQYYQVAVGLQPSNPQTNYRLATCYRAIFDYTLAANYYQKAMELDETSFPLASFYLAQMQKSMGNFKNARDGFQHFIETNGRNSLIPEDQRSAFMKQAEVELEGSVWAIEQLGKSWRDMGFRIMPEPVNSAFNDYAAVPNAGAETITITSGRKGARGSLVDNRFGDYFTDNFRYRHQNGQWVEESMADHFERTNTKFSDGVGTYSSSGDRYYFTSCYEGSAFCKLYVTYRENGVWKSPRLLNENVNAPGYDNKHPTLTSGGDTLIFVSNRPGGAGGNDLWFSVSKNGENWEVPQPLPGQINTPFNEASPFYQRGNLLFFSSDGHAGIGGMDIFMAKMYASPQSTIQNLGTPFNSGYDDSFFSLGQGIGFLSSNRPGGQGKFDIYAFNLPRETEDLAEYLEETADGTYLRSRIRNNDGSNLYAARDEDQFYYDNMTEEERQKLERILQMKQNNQANFNPTDLSSDDYKYYKKLDIGTKATIERLAVKRMLELEGQVSTNHMTTQEKLDWEFYHSVDEQERDIIDRIIDISVEARRRAVSNLSSEGKLYTEDPSNQERITSKLQLQSLNSQADLLAEQQQQATEKFNQNKEVIESPEVSGLGPGQEHAGERSQDYFASIEAMGSQFLNQYQALTPRQRNDLHQSALREYINSSSQLDEVQKQQLLKQFSLDSGPFNVNPGPARNSTPGELLQLRDALKRDIAGQHQSGNYSSVGSLIKQEMEAQQLILRQELQQLTSQEIQTRELQQQVEQYIEEQGPASNPALEQEIVEEYYAQLQLLLPLLTPRESNYLKSLDPGRQLRIDRLARLVEVQTVEYQTSSAPVGKEYLTDQLASDQWYYKELSAQEQQIVDELVAHNWDGQTVFDPRHQEFISGLSASERERLERMVGLQDQSILLTYENIDHASREGPTETIGHTPREASTETIDTGNRTTKSQAKNNQNEKENLPVINEQTTFPGIRIYFDFNQFTLRSEAKKALNDLVGFLKTQNQPIKILVEGHADDIGGTSQNDLLSAQRSQSAAEYLRTSSNLIEVTTRSYGERKPVSTNKTALGRQLNRRVELKIQGVLYHSLFQTFLTKPGATINMLHEATGLLKQDIVSWNGLTGEELKPYQPVRLPADIDYSAVRHLLYRPPAPAPENENSGYHTVRHGENLFRLSLQYSTIVKTLKKLNNLDASELKAGQQIRVR